MHTFYCTLMTNLCNESYCSFSNCKSHSTATHEPSLPSLSLPSLPLPFLPLSSFLSPSTSSLSPSSPSSLSLPLDINECYVYTLLITADQLSTDQFLLGSTARQNQTIKYMTTGSSERHYTTCRCCFVFAWATCFRLMQELQVHVFHYSACSFSYFSDVLTYTWSHVWL